jgi:hypothetical protein
MRDANHLFVIISFETEDSWKILEFNLSLIIGQFLLLSETLRNKKMSIIIYQQR